MTDDQLKVVKALASALNYTESRILIFKEKVGNVAWFEFKGDVTLTKEFVQQVKENFENINIVVCGIDNDVALITWE